MKAEETAVVWRDFDPLRDPGPGCDRVYLGDESCERLLPSAARLKEALAWSKRRGLGLSLLTPILTDKGIEQLSALLDSLAGHDSLRHEIIVNDWGSMRLLEKRHRGRFECVMGRLLLTSPMAHGGMNLLHDGLLDFLAERGITRLEFNSAADLAANHSSLRERGLKAHLYYPLVHMYTTRYCVFANGGAAYPRDAIETCGKECLGRSGTMTFTQLAGPKMVLQGKAHLSRQPEHPDAESLEVQRIVKNSAQVLSAGRPREPLAS